MRFWEPQRPSRVVAHVHDITKLVLRGMSLSLQEATVNAILQRAANRQGGLAAAAAARNAAADAATPQNNDYHKNSFKCSKCHRVGACLSASYIA